MKRKSASISLVMLGTAGVFLGCSSGTKPTGTGTQTSGNYRYRSHSVIFIPMGGWGGGSVGGIGRSPASLSPGRSGFGRSGSIGG